MTESPFELDANGFLVPPSFGGETAAAFPAQPVAATPVTAAPPQASVTPMPPVMRVATAPARPLPPAGRLNWIFGVLGIVTGLASFIWPLVCLTVLVSLALSAVGISRANRLRRRGANGRGVAIVALVIGLASAANLVFGFSSMLELQSQLSGLLGAVG